MRKFRLPRHSNGNLKHVSVLVRITNVFLAPRFDLFVDPWRLIASEQLTLPGVWGLTASITEEAYRNVSGSSPAHMSFPADRQSALGSQLSSQGPTGVRTLRTAWPHNGMQFGAESSYHANAPYTSTSPFDTQPLDREHPIFPVYIVPFNSTLMGQRPQYPWPSQELGAMSHVNLRVPTAEYSSSRYPPNELASLSQLPPSAAFRQAQNAPVSQQSSYSPWRYDPDYARVRPVVDQLGGTQSHQQPSGQSTLNPTAPSFTSNLLPRTGMSSQLATDGDPTECLKVAIPPSDLSKYRYTPLEKTEIRLLMLYPGSDTTLRGTIFRAPFQLAGPYYALSYAWGNDSICSSLWTPEGTIGITDSLQRALMCVRNPTEPLILWVDALCINQADLEEKVEQIRLLPRIFQQAICVIAHLGGKDDGDDTETAIETLMQIRAKEALSHSEGEWPKDLTEVPPDWATKPIPPSNDSVWEKIDSFFGRDWFGRAWVIQEIVVVSSIKILSGNWMVDWNDVANAIQVVQREEAGMSCHPSEPLARARSRWTHFLMLVEQREQEARQQRLPLLELLERFRGAKSTLEHDRFFCLLGLAGDGNDPHFMLNYQPEFDVVVRKYAAAFIRQGKMMEMLHRAGIVSSRPAAKFPSFIPDWTAPKPESLRALAAQGMPCNASAAEPIFEFDAGRDEFELSVHGIKVDTINIVSQAVNVPEQLYDYLSEVDGLIRAEFGDSYEISLTWMVLIAGATLPRVAGSDMLASYIALQTYLRKDPGQAAVNHSFDVLREAGPGPGPDTTTTDEEESQLWAECKSFFLALQEESLIGWRFFVTDKGYIGLAPPEAQRGDVVSVFDGGVVPFLLRRCAWTDGTFLLVGECYVSELMNGQASTLGLPESMIRLR